MARKRIVVIGSSNVDMIMKVERIPQLGETVTDGAFSQVFGGKGANQAVGAARAGGEVSFVTCIGRDALGSAMTDAFAAEGIDTRFVFQEGGIASGTALILVDGEGSNMIAVAPGANYHLRPFHVDQAGELMREASLVMLQCEILPATLDYVLDRAFTLGVPVLLNLAPARPLAPAQLAKVHWLVVNETEAALLSGLSVADEAGALRAIDHLLPMVGGGVVLTMGAKGALLGHEGRVSKVDAFPVKAVDTTAAGDVFCGSLAVALTEGNDPEAAVRFASAAAALACTRLGAQPSAPKRPEIEKLLKENA